MLKVGFFGIEGVGKTSVTTVLSFITSYFMEEEGKIGAVLDADLHKADLTNLLLGEEGFNGLHDILLGNKLPEEVVYDPLISLENSCIRRRLSDLIKLKVIPAGDKDPSSLMYEPIDLLLFRLRSLEDYIRRIGVGLLLVDLPSSDSSVRILLKSISKWVDLLIPIMLPDKSSILQTKRHLLSLEISKHSIPFVIINKYEPDLEQNTGIAEVIRSYLGVPFYLLPHDAELSKSIQGGSITLPEIHRMDFCLSLINGYGDCLITGKHSVIEHIIEIFRARSSDHVPSKVFLKSTDASEREFSSSWGSSLVQVERVYPRIRPVQQTSILKRYPVPKDIYKEIDDLKPLGSLPQISGRKFKLMYPSGKVVFISRRKLRQALILAGLDRKSADKLTSRQELDLSSISLELKRFFNLALAFLRLREVEEDFLKSK